MGFNFNNIDTTNKYNEFHKSLKWGVIDKTLNGKFEEAKKHGNIGLMFFYHFLDRLVQNIKNKQIKNSSPKIDEMMNSQSIALLEDLKAIKDFNEEYGFEDAEAIHHVLYILQKANYEKKIK